MGENLLHVRHNECIMQFIVPSNNVLNIASPQSDEHNGTLHPSRTYLFFLEKTKLDVEESDVLLKV